MSDFEGLFALFGLMFGLIVAELSLKMADAIDSSHERPIGILTPALALLVLTDVTSFWLHLVGPQRLEGQLAHRVRQRPHRQSSISLPHHLCFHARTAAGAISTTITGRASDWSVPA